MKEIQISTFKAQCLQILDEVNRTEEGIIITRRGQPLVEINPIKTEPNRVFGIGSGTAKIIGDIISPALN
ncbi:MAG: type II toxin-antitoxin system Phd/YefM family antitoxin [Cyanobacteria bacterium P01_F01_bin.143]